MSAALLVLLLMNLAATGALTYILWLKVAWFRRTVFDIMAEEIRRQDDRIQKRVERASDGSGTAEDRVLTGSEAMRRDDMDGKLEAGVPWRPR